MGMLSLDVSMIFLVLYLLSFLSISSAAVPNYRVSSCSNATTFTPNSTYQFNLNHLLSSLSSNATRESGFYNTTAGQNPATSIYGLFLCRGDLTTDACRDCVATAATEIVQLYCPVEKVAVVWYDECTLRYSNQSFFFTMEERPKIFMWNAGNVTEPDRFFGLAESTLNDLVPWAANASLGAKKFAVKEVPFTELRTLYNLVQCTPYISSSDCSRCLRAAIKNLRTYCYGKQGGRALYPSCNLRYETYPFYQKQSVAATAPTPTPVLLPPPAPGTVLKLQPYRQKTLALRKNYKLSPRYYGPFLILQRIGPVAYKLDLPSSAQIHPIFHVSCLKLCVGPPLPASVHLPPVDSHGELRPEPKQILQRRLVKQRNKPIVELLVKWKGEESENFTWVTADRLQLFIPTLWARSFDERVNVISHLCNNV